MLFTEGLASPVQESLRDPQVKIRKSLRAESSESKFKFGPLCRTQSTEALTRLYSFAMQAQSASFKYRTSPVIGQPAHRANPVIGPSKGLHQVSAITGELRETGGWFKRREYDFGAKYVNEFIVL